MRHQIKWAETTIFLAFKNFIRGITAVAITININLRINDAPSAREAFPRAVKFAFSKFRLRSSLFTIFTAVTAFDHIACCGIGVLPQVISIYNAIIGFRYS